MPKPRDIPFSRMQIISDAPVFVKYFSRYGNVAMKTEAHRDDYYIVAFLTDGSATVEIDFEQIELHTGEVLIVSPWQVHGKPSTAAWRVDGWILAFAPEMLTDTEAQLIEQYSISPRPFRPGNSIINDISLMCSILERNSDNISISAAMASAIKTIVVSTLYISDGDISGRYSAIALKLRKLIDIHITSEKGPAAYAAMLNISEVYLNEAVKAVTGLSAGAYIRSRAILQAKRQLAYTSLSAKEIAYALGYDDYAYFSKLFKKSVGRSPSEYRKNLK